MKASNITRIAFLLSLLFLVPALSAGSNATPVINVSASLSGATVNLNGNIYATAVNATGIAASINLQDTTISWGDPENNTITTLQECEAYCSHQYPQPGNYTIFIDAVDSFGNINQQYLNVSIASGAPTSTNSTPPAIEVSASVSGNIVNLSGNIYARSIAPNGVHATINAQATHIFWGDPDNSTNTTLSECYSYCGHAYSQSGSYQIKVFAIDSLNYSSSQSLQVLLSNSSGSSAPPIIQVSGQVAGNLATLNGTIYANAVNSQGAKATMNTQATTISWGDPQNSTNSTMAQCETYCSHAYSQAGTYIITISALDSFGDHSSKQIQLTAGSNSAPSQNGAKPSIDVSTSVSGDMITLNGNIWANAVDSSGVSASMDAQQTTIYWGDQNNLTTTTMAQCEAYCGHTYSKSGNYEITIDAVDSFGNTNQESLYATTAVNESSTVQITGEFAKPSIAVNASVNGSTANLSGSIWANAINAFGQRAQINAQLTTIAWGDPNTPTTSTLQQCESSCAHTYSQPGNYTISIEAVDGFGNSAVDYIKVSVS